MRNPIHIIHNHRRLPEIPHDGNLFVLSPSYDEYQIAVDIEGHSSRFIDCRTNLRYEVVVSVDGLSVMDGKPASTAGRGYIVTAGQQLVIPGWRMSASGAAKFVFSDVCGTYGELMGHGSKNVGVIGAAVFVEKVPLPVEPLTLSSSLEHHHHSGGPCLSTRGGVPKSINTSATRSAGDISATVGTGFGDATRFDTRQVDFERGEQVGVFTLYYRTAEWMRAAGIPFPGEGVGDSSAFPADAGCTPPPGWRPRG